MHKGEPHTIDQWTFLGSALCHHFCIQERKAKATGRLSVFVFWELSGLRQDKTPKRSASAVSEASVSAKASPKRPGDAHEHDTHTHTHTHDGVCVETELSRVTRASDVET